MPISIQRFTDQGLTGSERTEFHEELKAMILQVENHEIVDLLEKSQWINYYPSSLMPIICPLSVYYGRKKSVNWLIKNVKYGGTAALGEILANMMKLGIADSIPSKWKTSENVLPLISDDLSLTKDYCEKNVNAINEVFASDEGFQRTTEECMLHILHLDKKQNNIERDNVTVVTKFVCTQDQTDIDKLKCLLKTRKLSMDEAMEICRFDSLCHEMLAVIADHIDKKDLKTFLKTIMKDIDRGICYYELNDDLGIGCIFYCAMRLKISPETLCKKIIKTGDDEEYTNDYMNDYKKFIAGFKLNCEKSAKD